jgi:glycosyltransferase involved in cell wall biosynthesis
MERFQDLKLYDERIAVKFTMIGHPVDTEKFKPILKKSFKDGVLRILTVSRLVPEKGLYYILEAISLILSERNDVVWEIVGEGPMKPLLEQEARERNLSQKIRFCEKVPHDEVASVLGSADIFINHAVPTKRWEEYFGAVNIEAMACGLPCILSKTGGIPYAIREAGVCVMVDPRDVAQIRKALETLIANSGLRTKMGVRARKYVKDNYDIDLIADRFDRMICCRKHSRDIQGHEKDRNP